MKAATYCRECNQPHVTDNPARDYPDMARRAPKLEPGEVWCANCERVMRPRTAKGFS